MAVPALPTAHAVTGANFDNIVIIAMENTGYQDVIGSSSQAPFMNNQLVPVSANLSHLQDYGAAGRSVNGCSAACYTTLIGADNSISDGYSCCLSGPTLVDRMAASGLTWKAYCESGCPRGSDHFPFTGFATTSNSPNIFTSGSVSTSNFISAANSANPPNLLWYTPTDGHNMHDNSVSSGDTYVQNFLVGSGTVSSPAAGSLLASSLFTSGKRVLLLLWWDECGASNGGSGCNSNGDTPNIWYGPNAGIKAGFTSQVNNAYDEYSILHQIENNWALPAINSVDGAAQAVSDIFGSSTPPALSTSFTVSPSTPIINAPVTFTAITTGGKSPYTTTWNFGDGATSTGTIATHTFTTAQSFTVTETATDSSTPTQTATSSKTIPIVTSLPLSTSFTFLPANPAVNSPVSFTAVITGGTIAYTINWNFGDGATASGPTTTHTYSSAQSFTVTMTATDSSSPKQTATATHTVVVSSSLAGNFDNTWYITNCPGGTETISNGVLQTRQSTPGGGSNSYGFCTGQRGTFPWHSTVGTAIPSGITSVTVSFNFLSRSLLSGSRYHLYIALYYQIPSSTSGGTTYSWLDTQSRVENIDGTDSSIGSTATYDPGDSFGWDIVTLQANPGQSGTLTADATQLCQGDLAAWGLPANTQCTLQGIEIGTEGYLVNSVNVDWYNLAFNAGPIPILNPLTLAVPGNQTVTTGAWINFTVTPTDLNPGRIVTLSATRLPAGATFDPSTGFFSWKPGSSQTGYYTITFTATDDSSPPSSSTKHMGFQVNQAASGGSGGGGSGGSSNGGCLLCGTFPAISTSTWLLMMGGLLGFVTSLALLTIKARANLKHTKRRLKRLTREA